MENFLETEKPIEKLCSCRLKEEEKTFIDKVHAGNFSEYVHNCIKKDSSEYKKHNRVQSFKEFSLYVLMMGFGLMFLMFGIRSTTLIEMIISYVIGLFLFVFGISGGMIIALQTTRKQ